MSPVNRVGWLTLAALATLALVLFVAARCGAEQPTPRPLVDRLVAAQPRLQSRSEAAVDAQELAEAIASIPKVNAQWAALVLTIAAHESALSARIARGDCKRDECDGGRAWGLYQVHRNSDNAAAWGSTDIRVQTREAARMLRAVFHMCNAHGLTADWPARTLSAYAGRRCDAAWPGLDQRLATFERLRRELAA